MLPASIGALAGGGLIGFKAPDAHLRQVGLSAYASPDCALDFIGDLNICLLPQRTIKGSKGIMEHNATRIPKVNLDQLTSPD